MDYEFHLDDPIGGLIERADRFLSSQKDSLVAGFAQILGQAVAGPRTPPTPQAGPAREPRRPPPPTPPPKESPRDVLGFSPTAKLTRVTIKTRQKALAKLLHPDAGGSDAAMRRINTATAELLASLK